MKKFWKALGLTALAAAVLPYRVRRDKEENVTTVDALLWQFIRRPGQGEEKGQVDITLGFKSPLQEVREERELFTDDPDEAVLFAGAGPKDGAAEAAGIAEEQAEAAAGEFAARTEEAEASEEASEPVVTEDDFDPDL